MSDDKPIFYRGRGEHSVNDLECVIDQLKKENEGLKAEIRASSSNTQQEMYAELKQLREAIRSAVDGLQVIEVAYPTSGERMAHQDYARDLADRLRALLEGKT